MPIQNVWAWTQYADATSSVYSVGTGRVTGSMDINMPTQLTVYASTAIQRFRVVQSSPYEGHFPGQDLDVNSIIESYTINGAPQESGLNVMIDHNVDSVTFTWNVFPGFSGQAGIGGNAEVEAQFLFQVFGWGTRRPRGALP